MIAVTAENCLSVCVTITFLTIVFLPRKTILSSIFRKRELGLGEVSWCVGGYAARQVAVALCSALRGPVHGPAVSRRGGARPLRNHGTAGPQTRLPPAQERAGSPVMPQAAWLPSRRLLNRDRAQKSGRSSETSLNFFTVHFLFYCVSSWLRYQTRTRRCCRN